MARTMRNWTDFAEQRMHPFDYVEELPEHFADVEGFINEDAEVIDGQTRAVSKNTQSFREWVEYFERAKVADSVQAPLAEAREAMDRAEQAHRQLADALGDASECVGRARTAAIAEYGDTNVPRFDQA
jgi:hypothetical protein